MPLAIDHSAALSGLIGLECDPHAGSLGLDGDRAQSVGDDLAGPIWVEPGAGPGQADDRGWTEGGEAMDRCAQVVDPLLRVGRPAEQRQRQNRRNRRHGRRRLEPAPLERVDRGGVVAVLGQLQLPDPDPVEPGRGVGGEVLVEARAERRDLRDREARRAPPAGGFWGSSACSVPAVSAEQAGSSHSSPGPARRAHAGKSRRRSRSTAGAFSSSWATIVPEPAPRPGPGQVLAPMCQRPSIPVRWPGRLENGRQRKF